MQLIKPFPHYAPRSLALATLALVACSEDAAPASEHDAALVSPSVVQPEGGANGQPVAAGTDGATGLLDGGTSTSDGGSSQPAPVGQLDGGAESYVWPSDCDAHHKLLAHNNPGIADTSKKQIGAGAQFYASYYFRAPWGSSDVQGLKFRSIVDNKRIVHHWILYGVNSATEQDGAVQGGEGQPIGSMSGEFYVAGWAPGAPDITLPDGVGLHMPAGPGAMLRLEIHYFNTAPDAKVEEDASGVEMCVTSKKRAAEAAIHWLGSTSITLAPTGTTDVKSTCRPQITSGPVHLISISSHMHKLGVHSTATLRRANNGGSVKLIDDPFSFMEQGGFQLPRDGSSADVLVNAGDTIDVSCSYNNTTGQAVRFGSNTENEMCFFYAMAWPRGQLRNGSVFSVVPGAEPEVNCIQ